ncbi:hypothetical protein FJZ19_02665 [Candidatus Pacearchaeota archaeon]|nr:hypothetical protein [Candidatus Pacearchaeota archaeon]
MVIEADVEAEILRRMYEKAQDLDELIPLTWEQFLGKAPPSFKPRLSDRMLFRRMVEARREEISQARQNGIGLNYIAINFLIDYPYEFAKWRDE